jgi:hypothetical protein
MAVASSAASTSRLVCLLCCRLVDPRQPRCPAFALAGIAAHASCCGGCATPGSVAGRPAGNPATAAPALPIRLAPKVAASREGVAG